MDKTRRRPWMSRWMIGVVVFGIAIGVALRAPAQPTGPIVTYLGIARADGEIINPVGPGQPPVYRRSLGFGFTLVVEGRPGSSGRLIGDSTFTPGALPDFQIAVDRDLGSGSPAVCDDAGVPGTFDLSSIDAVNDLACRFYFNPSPCLSQFANPSSMRQYCAFIGPALAFKEGPTQVVVRLRDLIGNVGPTAQMVIEIVPDATATPTDTPATAVSTATPTATATRTSTIAPVICLGDCDRDSHVTIDEIVRGVNIAGGRMEPDACEAFGGLDGVSVSELVRAVVHALEGCPPSLTAR